MCDSSNFKLFWDSKQMDAELLFTVWSIVQSLKVQVSGCLWEDSLQCDAGYLMHNKLARTHCMLKSSHIMISVKPDKA